MGILDGKRHPGDRGAHRLLDRLPRGAHRPAGRRHGGAHRVRPAQPGASGSPSGCPSPPPVIELDVTDPAQLASLAERVAEHLRRPGRRGAQHRQRPAGRAGRQLPGHRVGGRGHRDAGVHLLAQGAGHGGAAADGPAGLDRRPGLRRVRGLAGLRLDGRGQGRRWSRAARYLARYLGPRGIRVNLVAAGPLRTMAAKSIPGFAAVRGHVAGAGAAGLGHFRPGARPRGPAWRCCPTGSRRPPARSCTSTAGSMRSGADQRRPWRPGSSCSPCPARTGRASCTRWPPTCTAQGSTSWTASSSPT